MLRIITGVFQPDLEQALVENVRRHKADDPLAPLLLLVPSAPLRRRLVQLLCHEHGQTLLNVRILTFHQFVLDLLAEAGSLLPEQFPSEAFFAELVGAVLASAEDILSAWQSIVQVPRAWDALWHTIRDVKNAGLDAPHLEALLEDSDPILILRLREPSLLRILQLAQRVLAAKSRLGVVDYDDLFAPAAEFVSSSRMLQACERIICYGFYDLHQLQLEFFRALVRNATVTLYAPWLPGHPAFVFAQQFFDRHIRGLCPSARIDCAEAPVISNAPPCTDADRSSPRSPLRHLFENVAPGPEAHCPSQGTPAIRRFDVPDAWDEIDLIAKAILQLVDEQGYAFEEIGVVARSLEGYERVIPRVFANHRIPFSSSMARPLDDYPLGQAIRLLLDVRETNFRREAVLELLGSPCIRLPGWDTDELRAMHDYWDASTRRLGIAKGFDQWQRLARFAQRDLQVPGRATGSEDEAVVLPVSAEILARLWHAVQDLHDHLQRFPEQASWETYVHSLMAVCERYLALSDGRGLEASGNYVDRDRSPIVETFYEGLADLIRLTPLRTAITFADFAAGVRRVLRQLTIPVSSTTGVGVQVLDAMEARGLSFRAVYVIGVNDGRFPRVIQEDAFLRDRHRRWIELDLGYKLPEKLKAIHEEQLLWYLLVNSARELLVLSSHRVDERNRPAVPSPYLAELERCAGPIPVENVPRPLSQKATRLSLYREIRLLPQELAVLWSVLQRDPHDVLDRIHPNWIVLVRAERALREHERTSGALGVFDGCVGALETVHRRLFENGCSPTELDEYARCPFRYFASRVLQIDALVDPGAVEEVSPSEWGTLIHEILRETYATLDARGYFMHPGTAGIDPLEVLETAARDIFARFAAGFPIGYGLLWESRCDRIVSFLKQVVEDDLTELFRSGWRPVSFEQSIRGVLTEDMGGPLTIQGRLDRIDLHEGYKTIRVIDYKCKWSGAPDAHDRNLVLGAVRAQRFQPPLYLAAVAQSQAGVLDAHDGTIQRCEGVWFYYLAPRWATDESHESLRFVRVKFPGHAWQSALREPLRWAVAVVVDGIRSGRFFIRPGAQCDSCVYFTMCRKTHHPTRWRVRRDPGGSAELSRLSQTTVPVAADTVPGGIEGSEKSPSIPT